MKLTKVLAVLVSALAAVGSAFAGIYMSFENMDAKPVLVEEPTSVGVRVNAFVEAVRACDYPAVSALLYGTPELGMDRQAADDVGILFWEAMESSRSCELTGQCYATDTGLAWDAQIECLDLRSVTANLRERAQTLLEQRVAAAEDTSEVYDENNEYREEFVMKVLYDAACQALEEDAETITYTFTLNLTYADGQWWIKPESSLLSAISGGILG